MNRLWIRLSVIISCIVIFVAVLPLTARLINWRYGRPPKEMLEPIIEGVPPERVEHFRKSVEQRFWEELSRLLVASAVLGIAAGILLSRWLTTSLKQLEQGARAIAEHRLDYRVPEEGARELRTVARAFNYMANELARQETLRRDMLADVTHELRHPIHVLRGSLQAILDGVYPLSMEEVAAMMRQTDHLAALTDDLHELAQAEAYELPLYRQETNLNDLVRVTVESLSPIAAGKEIELVMNIPPDPIVREIDAARMQQALLNLLNNALRYTPSGGKVTTSLTAAEDGVEIRVADTGRGSSVESLLRVFDRFYRADDNRDRKDSGSGLGLAIARANVQLHGGTIEAFSAGEEQGSQFVIRLP